MILTLAVPCLPSVRIAAAVALQRRNIEAGMSDLQATLKSRRERRADLDLAVTPGRRDCESSSAAASRTPQGSSFSINSPALSSSRGVEARPASASASPLPGSGAEARRARGVGGGGGGVRGGAIHGALPRARRGGARSGAGASGGAGAVGGVEASATPVSCCCRTTFFFFLQPS